MSFCPGWRVVRGYPDYPGIQIGPKVEKLSPAATFLGSALSFQWDCRKSLVFQYFSFTV